MAGAELFSKVNEYLRGHLMIKNKGLYLLICVVIGGGLGGYVSYITGNYIFSAIVPLVGIYLGAILNKYSEIGDLQKMRSKKYNSIFICIGIIMSMLGFIAYFYTKKIDMVIASIFFIFGSIYMITVKPKQ